ncbi:MAG: NAD+ synthase [Candidatus Brocadiaceae bacterium]|nr:NAD+ synthase [Candidatus Brocadiaceae bacterium]
MKVALAQINTTVGDVEGNARKAIEAIRRAAELRAELVVLPELTLSGYPPMDLVERRAFIEANERALQQVADAARGIRAVVGHVGRVAPQAGRPGANSASLVGDGRVLDRRDKVLLPTYDVFDEARLFEPAAGNTPVRLDSHALGVTICEDMWNDRFFWPRRRYGVDPVEGLAAAGVDLMLNLSASPFSIGKADVRRKMLAAMARRHGVPFACVNLVGGNDQLIFDGRSLAVDARGRLIAEAAAFAEDMLIVDTQAEGAAATPEADEMADVFRALTLGVADYARKCGFRRAVVALSGGLDSALTAAIAAEALGPENVTTLFLPTEFSSALSERDAAQTAANLGVTHHRIDIDPLRRAVLGVLEPIFRGTEPGIAEENVQARIRGLLVMAYANKFGHLPLATGNKSELAAGYCTLYGDMVGGLAVIGDLPKTTVYRLSRHLNRRRPVIPQSTLDRAPTAELKPDQTDQDVLPPYETLDAILNLYVEEAQERDQIVAAGHDPQTVDRVLRMVDRAEFKRRQAPMALRVTGRAFGPGRQLPIAQRWRR